ncbi:MAG: addiction module protein [Dehalococcoidia bacterium]
MMCQNKTRFYVEVALTKTLELFDEAISLPVEIRAQLVDELLRSLHPAQKEIDESWAVEAERRIEEIKSGRVKTIPGDKVFKALLGR